MLYTAIYLIERCVGVCECVCVILSLEVEDYSVGFCQHTGKLLRAAVCCKLVYIRDCRTVEHQRVQLKMKNKKNRLENGGCLL